MALVKIIMFATISYHYGEKMLCKKYQSSNNATATCIAYK